MSSILAETTKFNNQIQTIMCLYTRHLKPLVAERDIEVIKYLNRTSDNGYKTPSTGTPIKLDEILTAKPEKPDISEYDKDCMGNVIYTLSGGAIHARITPNGMTSCLRKAVIPKGTEYWIDPWGTEIAAKKMLITSEAGHSANTTTFAQDILDHAPKVNGVYVGDFMLEDGSFVRPSRKVVDQKPIGRVVGFKGRKPLIAALEKFGGCVDSEYQSKIDVYFPDPEEAMKDYSGKEHTQAYRELEAPNKRTRHSAFAKCVEYREGKGESWYLPALGEMLQMLNNAIYLNASYILSGLGFIVDPMMWFWTSSEYRQYGSWCCGLRSRRVLCDWRCKDFTYSVCPFLASKKKPLSDIWNKITKAFSRK